MSRLCGKLKRKSECGIRMFQGSVLYYGSINLWKAGKDVTFEKFFCLMTCFFHAFFMKMSFFCLVCNNV